MDDLPSPSSPRDLINARSKRHCPASFWNLGGRAPRANPNSPSLKRWNATWEALARQLGGMTGSPHPEQDFDPVQAAIVAAQIRTAKSRLPSASGGEVDLDWPAVSFPIDAEELRVFFQFAVTQPDGRLEMYKLKTGHVGEESEFATPAEEIAAVVSDPRFPDEMEAYEWRATDGEVIRLEMDRDKARQKLDDLKRDYLRMLESDPEEVRPGPHCSTCKVADRCRTFPAIKPRAKEIVPVGKPLPSHIRLMIPKSRLPEMDFCQRRAAWRAVFSIPPDPDHYWSEVSPSLELGNRFHNLMAEALLSDNPASHFSGDLETESLYRQHLSLPCTPGLRITRTEFPLGFAVRIPTWHGPTSVVLYGLADGAGRESDDIPAVIDHKTGRSPRTYPYEAEIYAMGALLRFSTAPAVATHIHHLSTAGDEPVCDRKVWKRELIQNLATQLGSLAETVAGWNYLDATSPPYEVGDWCSTCPFEQRCRDHRS